MKLSVEAKVAAAVAASFVALTVGTIAKGTSDNQAREPNGYGPTNNPRVNTNAIEQADDRFLSDRINIEESRTRPSL
jgi:hypothetical protein